MGINPAARARLFCKGSTGSRYYTGPASVLRATDGLLFPLTPTINYSQSVTYSPYDLIHTNYTFFSYRNTPSPSIQIQSTFTNTTDEEHRYTSGVLHFLRSVTKMWYGAGEDQGIRGAPPPVLKFSAFGPQIFNNVDVFVSSVATFFDDNVDLITGTNGNALPAVMNIAIDLSVTVSPKKQKEDFTTSGFISGSLYGRGFI